MRRDGGGDLPAEELLADGERAGDVDAHDDRAGRFERGDAGILRRVGRGGEPQIDEDAIGAVAIGRRQRLEIDRHDRLPVLARRLGDQLLEPGAEALDAGRGDERELVAAGDRGGAEQQPERRRRGCSRPAPTGSRRPSAPSRRGRRRRRGPSPRPAPARTARAPSSARRWSARRRRCAGSRRPWPGLRASIPGSVMATKRRAASAGPRTAATRSKKYCWKALGSSVLPDLLATITSVRSRSTRPSSAATCDGTVESRTCSSGAPGWRPKVRASTSGHRLEPPMPSSSACVKPSRRTPAAMSWSAGSERAAGVDGAEPAEPPRLVGAGPERRVLVPQPARAAGAVPLLRRLASPDRPAPRGPARPARSRLLPCPS